MGDDAGIVLCTGAGCGQPIRWVMTLGGRRMPIDPDPSPDGTIVRVVTEDGSIRAKVLGGAELPAQATAWVAHWATCPAGDTFRRRQRTVRIDCEACDQPLDQVLYAKGYRRHPLCMPPTPAEIRELMGSAGVPSPVPAEPDHLFTEEII